MSTTTRRPGPPQLTDAYLAAKIREALDEDLGPDRHDVTTEAVVPASLQAEAEVLVKAPGVLAGGPIAAEVFRQVDPAIELERLLPDGAVVEERQVVIRVRGSLRSLLEAERTALNLLQQLSGIATLTRRYVEQAPGVAVLDTRKTAAGLRPLQRYAVAMGGGVNHRYNLRDAVLVKDNHVAAAGGTAAAIRLARRSGLPVEVEVETLDELESALAEGAEAVLLDNMSPQLVEEAVRRTEGRAKLEVSGGVSLATIGAYAATGVDRISIGALTHSAPALDISMEVTRTWQS
ncbi:MAG: carboxylating nicotinate-nucleotide diphosphorylase [Candidatus Dormiibacterota bacterium]